MFTRFGRFLSVKDEAVTEGFTELIVGYDEINCGYYKQFKIFNHRFSFGWTSKKAEPTKEDMVEINKIKSNRNYEETNKKLFGAGS